MDTSTRSGLSVGKSEEESRDPDDYVPVLYVDCKTKLYHKKTIFCTINGNVANECNFVFAKIGPGVNAICRRPMNKNWTRKNYKNLYY